MDLSTQPHADLIFEVSPNPDAFDTVRRAIVQRLESDYSTVMVADLREHIRVDTIDVKAASWDVRGRLNNGHDVRFDVTLRSDTDATADVLDYLRDRLDDRFGPTIDPDPIVFERIGMRPSAWFVDAKVPPSADGFGDD